MANDSTRPAPGQIILLTRDDGSVVQAVVIDTLPDNHYAIIVRGDAPTNIYAVKGERIARKEE